MKSNWSNSEFYGCVVMIAIAFLGLVRSFQIIQSLQTRVGQLTQVIVQLHPGIVKKR